MEVPRVTEARREQPLNADEPIEVAEFGIWTEVRPEHPEKVASLIEVTELPSVIDTRPVQVVYLLVIDVQ